MEDYIKTNQALWDAKTPIHLASDFYDMKSFRAGKSSLNTIELEGLGSVVGKSMLHLQCHFGQDTLSWAKMGAQVTGIDLSPVAIQQAKALSQEMDIPAQFVASDIYDLPTNLDSSLEQSFDIVFTSYGTVIWLPNVDCWAGIVNRYLKPGGTFYFVDFHPFINCWEDQKIQFPYFNPGYSFEEEEEGTYADNGANIKQKEFFWMHSIAETLQALLKQGLVLEEIQEYDYSPYNCFADMKERAPGEFVYGDFGVAMPHLYSLKMKKPN